MNSNKTILFILVILVIITGSFFYFSNKVNYSHGTSKQIESVTIEKGESVIEIGKKLDKEKIISNYIYFVYYAVANGLHSKIVAGEYEINPELTIPEIIRILSQQKEAPAQQVKITFPEGWSAKKMADRLNANNLPGDEFISLTNNPSETVVFKYGILSDRPEKSSLEGYLFPDTYFFSAEASGEDIVMKMLRNFDDKMTATMRDEIQTQGKSFFEIITMASVIENEVRSEEDRKIVSDIFWGRIKIGQPLESCATLAYILGVNKKQYSFSDTRIESLYNTYINKGLPPGPISNPGIISIKAAIYPTETNYNYFLSDPETGETVFSSTLDEHNANKVKHGL